MKNKIKYLALTTLTLFFVGASVYSCTYKERGLDTTPVTATVPVIPTPPTTVDLAPASIRVVSELTKLSLEICLNASNANDSRLFFGEGLGLFEQEYKQTQGTGSNPMQMLIFKSGSSSIKVRVYEDTPRKRASDISVVNGFRVLKIPIVDLDTTVKRLQKLGFETTAVQKTGNARWSLTHNKDGTAFELVESSSGSLEELEIGLLVPDLQKAREFFTGVYGARELPSSTSRILANEKELRFSTGGTIFKCWAPTGNRESDEGKIPDYLGFRYITHNVKNTSLLYETLQRNGVDMMGTIGSTVGSVSVFAARGPGGAILEFVGPAVKEKTAPIAKQIQAMFKKADLNGDGFINPNEAPNIFKNMDYDGDGKITLEETARYYSSSSPAGGGTITGKEPELTPSTNGAFLAFDFTTDYYADNYGGTNALFAATEANALVAHNGMLFCATSYMPESGLLKDINPKILVKKSATSPWQVDFEAGSNFMRLGFLKSVAFTTDSNGKKLPEPVSVLIAGPGSWRSQMAAAKGTYVFTRNDKTGQWIKTKLSSETRNVTETNHTTEIRCIFDHIDTVTGIHHVFAGSGIGRLFQGVYDPTQPGLIKWQETPVIDGLEGHFLCAAEANGVQYAGVAYGPVAGDERLTSDRPTKDHGLWRRVDGLNAFWEWIPVKEWEDPNRPGMSLRTAQFRGLTAVPAPDGDGEVLLVAWDTKDAVIERIDPRNNFKITVELNVKDYFLKEWGRSPGISTFAYNDMPSAIYLSTGEQVNLIGLWLIHPSRESNELGKSSWYLVRYHDGKYRYQRIWDPSNALDNSRYGLRGCRSICASPFLEEAGRVWYFCGFDQTDAVGEGATGPRAWIYRGELPKK